MHYTRMTGQWLEQIHFYENMPTTSLRCWFSELHNLFFKKAKMRNISCLEWSLTHEPPPYSYWQASCTQDKCRLMQSEELATIASRRLHQMALPLQPCDYLSQWVWNSLAVHPVSMGLAKLVQRSSFPHKQFLCSQHHFLNIVRCPRKFPSAYNAA